MQCYLEFMALAASPVLPPLALNAIESLKRGGNLEFANSFEVLLTLLRALNYRYRNGNHVVYEMNTITARTHRHVCVKTAQKKVRKMMCDDVR